MHKLIIILFFCLVFAPQSWAATHAAVTCSNADIQTAIDASASGDIVTIPGTSCTWVGAIDIPTGKAITLQGAGYENTIITYTTTMIDANESGARITGIQFVFPSGVSAGNAMLYMQGTGWRVDNCKFTNNSGNSQTGVYTDMANVSNQPAGLIDNNYFYISRVVIGLALGVKSQAGWATDLNLGGEDSVFIENNYFESIATRNVVDANYAGYYVFRYNTVENSSCMAHGVQGSNRGARKWEIYNNLFKQTGTAAYPAFLRAGTGVFYNNELEGTWSTPSIEIDHIRSCSDETTSGLCDGDDPSPWDENQVGQDGYRCRDQIGASKDTVQWVDTAGSEGAFTQTTAPAYAWNNYIYTNAANRLSKTGGSAVEFHPKGVCASEANHLQSGRDFINNGTTAKPGYTPYTCPHPLAGDGSCNPSIAGTGGYALGSGGTTFMTGGTHSMTLTGGSHSLSW